MGACLIQVQVQVQVRSQPGFRLTLCLFALPSRSALRYIGFSIFLFFFNTILTDRSADSRPLALQTTLLSTAPLTLAIEIHHQTICGSPITLAAKDSLTSIHKNKSKERVCLLLNGNKYTHIYFIRGMHLSGS